MAGPITWRTVTGPSLADAYRPLEGARQSFTDAFAGLGTLLKEQQAVNQGTIDRQDEGNVQGLLDRLQRAGTVQEVDALRSSGEIDALRASLKPKDLARVRGAEDARATNLMQQMGVRNTFNDAQLDREQAPLRDQIMGLVASNKMDEANQLYRANPQLRNGAAIMQAITNGERDFQKFGWLQDDAKQKAALAPLQVQQAQASIAASTQAVESSKAQLEAAAEARNLAAEQRASAKAAATVAAKAQLLKETGNVFADGVFTPANSQELLELMVKNGIGDDNGERQAIIKRFSDLTEVGLDYVDGNNKVVNKKIPVPLSLVKQAVLGSKDEFFNMWNDGYANTAEENLRKSLLATMPAKTQDGRAYTQNKAAYDYEMMMRNRLEAAENPAPANSKKK